MELGKNTVFVILVIALLAIGAYLFVNVDSSGNTISVNGDSEVKTKADFVGLYLSIETLENSAQESESNNAEISEAVMSQLRALGFEDEDIETLSFNVYPDYKYNNNGQVFNGYKTVNQMKISVEEIDFTGVVIDRVVQEGALINQVSFEITQEHENELKAEALEKATQDARTKAEAIAKGSGGRLGKLVSISTNDYYYYPYIAYAAEAGSADSVRAKESITQINSQELAVNANVQAVYKIR